MRNVAIVAGALAMACAAVSADAKPRLTGEQELAKLLEGREAGKPSSCIRLWDARNSTVIDKTALVYRSGNTIWVNRPNNAEDVDSDDILVTYPTGGDFCRLDRVQTVDRTGHFVTGFLMLGDFVPYRKVASAN